MNKFAPLTPQEIASAATIADDAPDAGICIMPVPHDAPPLPQTHRTPGQPMRWSYRCADGLLYEVWRFDPPGEPKQFYPLTLWRAANGRVEWRWKAPPSPRPLYGLDTIAANPGAPVVICEGEKSADAATKVFPKSVCVTSPGGSEAADKADWSPLAGRKVVIWPDADEPGAKYAKQVAEILIEKSCDVSIIDAEAVANLAPDGGNREPEKGWDAADAIGQWEDLESLRKAAASHTNSFAAHQGVANAEFGREIERLAKLKVIEYERERKAASKKLNIRAPVLDMLVKAARPSGDEPVPGQGRKLELNEPEPWPEPVSGPELIGELEAGILRYVALPKDGAFIVALWVLHTYCFDLFTCTPRLAITAPEKRCGKSTLIDVLYPLVARALLTVNTSPAAVFRTVELARPTLLIDEADTFLGEDEELRGILNSGHRKGGQVTQIVGDDFEPRMFSTHCAVAIAQIGKLPATLADRSIAVEMRRKAPGEKVERFRHGRTSELDEAARKAARWVADNMAAIDGRDPEIPEAIFNRAADNWEPLLTIGEAAGSEVADRARKVALAACGVEQEQSIGTLLLADIRDAFSERSATKVASAELVEALAAMADRPWAECRHGKPINQYWLARRLKDFGIRPGNIKIGGQVPKGYHVADFEDAFSRYLPKPGFQSATPLQSHELNDLDKNRRATVQDPVAARKSSDILKSLDYSGVAVQNPKSGANAHVPASQSPKAEKNAGAGTASWSGRV